MPRQSRIVLPGVAMHVIQRGNNRAACFRARSDYLVYLLHLQELARKLSCAVHAYCLMPNHVHLLLTPSGATACMNLMRELGQRYVQYFNRRYGRTGTLWEGRFRSSICESSHYVLACYRYIELNPVRAGLVPQPGDYEWSSHNGNIGRQSDSLLSPHLEFLALGTETGARRSAYLGLFQETMEPSLISAIREAAGSGFPLGSNAFRAGVLGPMGRTLEPGKPGRKRKAQSAGRNQSGSDPIPVSGSDPDFDFGL